MSDQNVNFTASDTLSLAGNFLPQNTNTETAWSYAEMVKANGDFQKFSDTFNGIITVNLVYKYNADTGLGAALPKVGQVKNGYLIDSITVETSYNDYPTITFVAHNHFENAHADDRNQYSVSASIISLLTGALGAYDFAGLAADEVCAQSSTYTLSANHIDAECSGGDHWVGQSVKGQESITITYIGAVASTTISGWTVTNYNYDDSNEAFDTSSITAIRTVARDT
jgi:hypothetical protein